MNTNTIPLRSDLGTDAARPAAGWLDPLLRVLASLRRRHHRRRAIAELSRMPDWRLEDMGIPRGRIADVVDGLVARRASGEVHRARV